MVPFQHGEVLGRGEGHHWAEGGSHNPTWCDLCGELIWGLYDTGLNNASTASGVPHSDRLGVHRFILKNTKKFKGGKRKREN
jgi:hypothetical protein